MKVFRYLLALISAWAAPAVNAATERPGWIEARTDHFVLITKDAEDKVRDFASRLERFDAAMRRLYAIPDNREQHKRPVTIYALELADFTSVCGCGGSGRLGWYSRPLDGPVITVAIDANEKERAKKVGALNSQALLLHEYSHHFMLANTPGPYAYWYVEGFAELNANVSFEADGSIRLGYPANYRGRALLEERPVPLRKLMAPEIYGRDENPDKTYGRAWLLSHYLTLRPERSGQLDRYLSAMSAGTPSMKAAEQAFGDFDTLDKELNRYIRSDMALVSIPTPDASPAIAVRHLSAGEQQILITWLMSRQGIANGYKKLVALDAAKTVRQFPEDERALTMAAEVALATDYHDKADLYADAVLALNPAASRAALVKGKVATSRALAAKPNDRTGWAAGRKWIVRANRAAPDEADLYYYYYASFLFAGETPPPIAVTGLRRARVLAPENQDVALALAREELREGQPAKARRLLLPLAFAPHAVRAENKTAALVALLDANKQAEASSALDNLLIGDRDGEKD